MIFILFLFIYLTTAQYTAVYSVQHHSNDVDLFTMLDQCTYFDNKYLKYTKKDDHTILKYSSNTDCNSLTLETEVQVDHLEDGISLYSGSYPLLEYVFGKPEPNVDTIIHIAAYKKLGCVDFDGTSFRDIKFDGYLVQFNEGTEVSICGSTAHDFTYRYAPGIPTNGIVFTIQTETNGLPACAVLLSAFLLFLLI